ncbi:MAG: dihydrodipicolinate synthase family protein [Anaerolineaceae bacterium]
MKPNDLEGIIPAVVVPMRSDYTIDFNVFEKYLEWVINQEPVGLAVNVDTGEGPYLTPDERFEIIRTARRVANGRCAIIAGIGGPATMAAVANARAARESGADALLVFPTPVYLNDPLDVLIPYHYHKAIADASDLPIIAFQLGPVFGGINYPPDALEKLLELPQIIGLKDASFDAQRFIQTRDVVRRADHPITMLTGNDNFLLESFIMGAKGGLLGFAAVGVGLLVDMLKAIQNKAVDQAVAMQERVQGFSDYIYGKPIGDYRARCKVALVPMGLLTPDVSYVRPPYLSLWETEKDLAYQAVAKAGLLTL